MNLEERCPKCGGQVITKHIKKTFGLGQVKFPVAQFCISPACNWYQDFTCAKPKENTPGLLMLINSIKSILRLG